MSTASGTRPMQWSVRREVWENRSVYIAPLIVAGVVLFACMVMTIGLPKRMRAAAAPTVTQGRGPVSRPYGMAPAPIMLATFLVGIFYSLDALYGERRERSILFWKSLPVSDRTTVLSKAAIPMVVLPVIALVLSWITLSVLMMFGTLVLLGSGVSPTPLWADWRIVQDPMIMSYGLAVHTLWFAPVYCWLLLLSAWARRTPVLWAVLPPLVIGMLERGMFGTTYFGTMVKYRVTGAMHAAFSGDPRSHEGSIDRLSQLEPARFLATPGLWVGLLFAAGCLLLAIRLRRDREPM